MSDVPILPSNAAAARAVAGPRRRRHGPLPRPRGRTRSGGPLLVIARDAAEVARLEDELRFFAPPALPVLAFPDYETLPYDQFSPHPDIISQRLRTLSRLPASRRGHRRRRPADLAAAAATAQFRRRARLRARGGRRTRPRGLPRPPDGGRLHQRAAGGGPGRVRHPRLAVRRVSDGQRGAAAHRPVRPAGRQHPQLRPGHAALERAAHAARAAAGARVQPRAGVDPRLPPPLPHALRGRPHAHAAVPRRGRGTRAGRHRVLPAAVLRGRPRACSTTCPTAPWSRCPADHEAGLDDAWRTVETRHEERGYDIEHPVLAPAELCLPPAEWTAAAGARGQLLLGGADRGATRRAGVAAVDLGTSEAPAARLDARREETIRAFAERLAAHPGRVLLAAESPGRRELLFDLLRPFGVEPRIVAGWDEFLAGDAPVAITVAPLASGVVLADPPVTLYAEEQLFGERARQERRRRRSERDPARIIQQLADLRPGAPVVHEDYGVGRYLGLTTHGRRRHARRVPGARVRRRRQALRAGAGARARQPLHRRAGGNRAAAQARQRPVGEGAREGRGAHPRRRGGTARRVRAARHAPRARLRRGRAAAARLRGGLPVRGDRGPGAPPSSRCSSDLRSPRPMDRVVCGDVGFGKTEVALRAAFVAVQAGRQVAVLVPTTLLAQQHYQTFADRFADWPVKVELLSRFRGDAQAKARARGPRGRQGGHRHRHAPPAAGRRALQGPRAPDRRRGAPLRRARQGAAQGAARRGGRAHAHRDADSAHPQHGARRTARPLADHHAAGGAAVASRPSSREWNATASSARPACASCAAAARCTSCTTPSRPSRRWRSSSRELVPEARDRRSATARCASATSSR